MRPRQITWFTAVMLVVATMIGTGVFTTTGFLIRDLQSNSAVILAWLFGGAAALCGALCYAELAAALPQSGGEYHLLSRIYHPAVGFVAGFLSLIVGFAAPVAASSLAFGEYLQAVVPGANPTLCALILLLLVTGVHLTSVQRASRFQDLFTVLKVLFIVGFIIGGLAYGHSENLYDMSSSTMTQTLMTPSFAVGLIFVSYAYSGWNSAAYVAGEVHDPARGLPIALVLGTLIVTLLYVGLNIVFLMSAPKSALSGVVEIGHVSAVSLFGERGGSLVSGMIALGLVSSVGAMVMAGPRIYARMGEDYPRLAWLAQRNDGGSPRNAILFQSLISAVVILSAGFEALLTYMGLTLSLMAGLTVVGVFVLRRREPTLDRPYRTLGYPLTPLIFIALSAWMICFSIMERPLAAVATLGTVLAGVLAYLWVRRCA